MLLASQLLCVYPSIPGYPKVNGQNCVLKSSQFYSKFCNHFAVVVGNLPVPLSIRSTSFRQSEANQSSEVCKLNQTTGVLEIRQPILGAVSLPNFKHPCKYNFSVRT